MLDKTLPILPIVRPTFPSLESIADRFSAALKSGQVTNGGRYVEEFEAALTEYLGVPTIAFSSGMAALIAMLMVEGVEGREVICPSFTFCATPHAIRLAGGKVVFADIDPKTLTLDPDDVERKITSRTKAILGVDVYGICCAYHELSNLAADNDLALLYDSAPAFGSLINGKPTASPNGCPQIFSLHATKSFAIGEGGALCSKNDLFIGHARKIRNFGLPSWPDTLWPTIGFNGKMQEVNALIGLQQLKRWPHLSSSRRAARKCLIDELLGIRGLKFTFEPIGQNPIWTYQPIQIEPEFGMFRDDVMRGLERRGIMTRKYYEACHLLDVYADCRASLPVTERVASEVIALPLYADMTVDECARIGDALRDIQAGG